MSTDAFRFEYAPGALRYGRGCVEPLDEELAQQGASNALLVTGQTVGTTEAVIDPVLEGGGDRIGPVFAETTPQKRLETVLDGLSVARTAEADAIVSLGGGSSLDVATAIRALSADDRDPETIREAFERNQTLSVTAEPLLPMLVLPTTLAGADCSMGAGINAHTEAGVIRGGCYDARLMPDALCYDPALIETTPSTVLYASAMNGFDKGIESLYSPASTPITDATAAHGLSLLAEGLPALGAGKRDDDTLHDAIVGTILVQYGVARADGSTLSVIHAFGHGINRGFEIQQGAAHGIVAPHVLAAVFERIDGNRTELARALGVANASDDHASAVVTAVTEIRDALGLAQSLRSIDDMDRSDLSSVAATIAADGLISNTPPGLDLSQSAIETVLERAW